MLLKIYKGFDIEFYKKIDFVPLVAMPIEERLNVFMYNKTFIKKLSTSLLNMDEEDIRWITYEEFTLIKDAVLNSITNLDLNLEIVINNIMPDVYSLNINIEDSVYLDFVKSKEQTGEIELNESVTMLTNIYNEIYLISDHYYASYYNFEYDTIARTNKILYYQEGNIIDEGETSFDYVVFSNEDVEGYLREYEEILTGSPKKVAFKSTKGFVSKRIESALLALGKVKGFDVYNYSDSIEDFNIDLEKLKTIAKKDIGISNFEDFRLLSFYKNPDIDKKTIEISQAVIISEIIRQAENAYDETKKYRDIFITAPTGAGKSVMFQIPAIYLAQKYNNPKPKLTIIIQPVLALMQDQIDHLRAAGYTRVEALNSMLATQIEKENVINRIKKGEVDLLYLSPETLLAYSIETIIGDREIGLLIIDEAHIVTTWGAGFRPDYWYLGGYINSVRHRIQDGHNKNKKIYRFPICAFTATAVNGGLDDTVSETIISLYMENPIKYIGNIKRENIVFDINVVKKEKTSVKEYEEAKRDLISKVSQETIEKGEKTIIYYPYAKTAYDAFNGYNNFNGIFKNPNKIATFTGSDFDGNSKEAIAARKREVLKKFKNGDYSVIYATKAFGMGVDVNDINNVYHYAITGNLSDYIQEIGRAARKQTMIGHAKIDFYSNDINYMKMLFGMSAIRQYQINKVISGIYDAYARKHKQSFLISPESFTHIFSGKGQSNDESTCINKLKTCLLMLEKDFYDKYTIKVLISRPQSIFTKGFVCVKDSEITNVLSSKYGKYFTYVAQGRKRVKRPDGILVSDYGDIYSIDLKSIWEEFYPNISFPQFKYWYFNKNSPSKDNIHIMKEISDSIYPRQRIIIKTKGDILLSELKSKIFDDIEYIGNSLYDKFEKRFFKINDFVNLISPKYGRTTASIIANSLFDLVDPSNYVVKPRRDDDMELYQYQLSNGTFKDVMKKSIIQSSLMGKLGLCDQEEFSEYIQPYNDTGTNWDLVALKLLSMFEYITYEVQGGEEPEIFIRLNDPAKLLSIKLGHIKYSNNYVVKAKQKHERDVNVLTKFFTELSETPERWDFIEDYFLGKDVLSSSSELVSKEVSLSSSFIKDRSYSTVSFFKWDDMLLYFDDDKQVIIKQFRDYGIPLPDYLSVVFKRDIIKSTGLMAWTEKNTVIFDNDITDEELAICHSKGWNAFRIIEINPIDLRGVLR